MNKTSPDTLARRLVANLETVIAGKRPVLENLVAAFVAGEHVLLEDVPGAGKTTLAKALAASVAARFHRVQFTPDQLPTDILGLSVFDQGRQEFRFHPGPVFTDILLADEVNRASPRTQSALLEAMAEHQVSIEGERHTLSPGFCVLATQNPVEFEGTYPLPESQMDRFGMRLALGYTSRAEEVAFTFRHVAAHPLDSLAACATLDDVLALREATRDVTVADPVQDYVVALVAATREAQGVRLGASPRASLSLARTAQVRAHMDGRDHVLPDDVQALAEPVLAHRLVLTAEAAFAGRTDRAVVAEVLDRVPVPA